MINPSSNLFNFDAVFFGGLMLFLLLIFHAVSNYLVINAYQKASRNFILAKKFRYTLFLFYGLSFVLVGCHLAEIFIWGATLFYSGLVPNFDQAILFAGSAYTTVGYGTIPLPIGWELLMVVIALDGMVAFGWTIVNLSNMQRTVQVARRLAKSNGYFM